MVCHFLILLYSSVGCLIQWGATVNPLDFPEESSAENGFPFLRPKICLLLRGLAQPVIGMAWLIGIFGVVWHPAVSDWGCEWETPPQLCTSLEVALISKPQPDCWMRRLGYAGSCTRVINCRIVSCQLGTPLRLVPHHLRWTNYSSVVHCQPWKAFVMCKYNVCHKVQVHQTIKLSLKFLFGAKATAKTFDWYWHWKCKLPETVV
jgi:hypothetical protein